MSTAIEVSGLTMSYGGPPGAHGCRLRGQDRRGLLPPRPERGRQDHHRRDPRRLQAAHRRDGQRPRHGPAGAVGQASRADRHRPAGMRLPAAGPGGGADRQLARLLQEPAGPGRPAEGRGAHPGQERPGAPPVRRAAPPPRPGTRPGRRPGPDLPRRADDRLRPGVAPPLLGGDREPAHARQDDRAHHPLPRRGGAPRRPGGDPAGRPHRGRRHGAARRPPGRGKNEDQIRRPRTSP